jgi:hypothetical protein
LPRMVAKLPASVHSKPSMEAQAILCQNFAGRVDCVKAPPLRLPTCP